MKGQSITLNILINTTNNENVGTICQWQHLTTKKNDDCYRLCQHNAGDDIDVHDIDDAWP